LPGGAMPQGRRHDRTPTRTLGGYGRETVKHIPPRRSRGQKGIDMRSYVYIAYTAEQDKNRMTFSERKNNEYCPGYYADVLRISSDDNIFSALSAIGGLKAANAFPSKKQAEETAAFWNECYKRNGTYLFA
jgi:hypothetical protein